MKIKSAHILLIEDNEDHAFLCKNALLSDNKNYSIDVVSSGDEGLAKLQQKEYDIILLDYNIPKLSGLLVLKEIRDRKLGTPIIMITGNGSERIAVDAMKYGSADYIVKESDYHLKLPSLVKKHLIKYHRFKEKKRREEEIFKTRELTEKVFNNIPVGIFTINKNGDIVSVNPAFLKIMGEEDINKVLGINILNLDNIKSMEGDTYFRRALAGESFRLDYVEFTTVRNKKLYLSVYITPIKNKDGNVEEVLTLIEDITERHRLYLDNQEKMKELEVANAALQEMNKMKSKFIMIAGHELRTPMVTIGGYVDLILNGGAGQISEEQKKMLNIVSRNASRLSGIIEDILDVSKISTGQLKLKVEDINIEDVINDAVLDFTPFADMRKQKIIFQRKQNGDKLFQIKGDRVRLGQVFANLLSNAIKYTPDGGEISIEVNRDNDYIHIIVSDTGIGIPKEEQEKIFEGFYEVKEPLKHSSGVTKFLGGGTGLGLAICRGIVTEHKGTIWVESEGMPQECILLLQKTTSGKEKISEPPKCPGSKFHILLPVDFTSISNTSISQELKNISEEYIISDAELKVRGSTNLFAQKLNELM